jgi:hypothetical protein
MQIVKLFLALATVAIGLISVLRPQGIYGFTGLAADSPRAISEIRAVLGGGFVGLGLAPLLFRDERAYRVLGLTYLAMAAVRLASVAVDRSYARSNLISLVIEAAFGLALLV